MPRSRTPTPPRAPAGRGSEPGPRRWTGRTTPPATRRRRGRAGPGTVAEQREVVLVDVDHAGAAPQPAPRHGGRHEVGVEGQHDPPPHGDGEDKRPGQPPGHARPATEAAHDGPRWAALRVAQA